MSHDEVRDQLSTPERWDRVANALAAEPRRQIIISLLNAPGERRVPLPDAATSPNAPVRATGLEMELRHHHLPMLAKAGYVRWDSDRFCVQRGPNFDEVGPVMELILESTDRLPNQLIEGCERLDQRVE